MGKIIIQLEQVDKKWDARKKYFTQKIYGVKNYFIISNGP